MLLPLLTPALADDSSAAGAGECWQVDFRDDFDTFDPGNWQDQLLWVNDEAQCYVRDGLHGSREVSDGTLKLRVVNVGEELPCDNLDKEGNQHPATRYVAGRIASKNLKEFVKGRWTARLRIADSGQDGMFPAWWLLGARNNEPPVQEADEDVCWPMTGSGEIDIFEHYGPKGPGHYTSAELEQFHDYSVEWQGDDLIFRRDGVETYRIPDRGADFPEPLFAILNFAKINDAPMEGKWEMEVDWVQHESCR
jgi:beta-glucanase (GH16 family)